MARKMFGHRIKKSPDTERTPGKPWNDQAYDRGDESEDNFKYVKGKDVRESGFPEGRSKDGPAGYEGKEHVKYRDPGHTRHHIRFPEDEPHMKSHVDSNEEHEAEDNYHMGIPDQTHYDLQKKIKRARMKMDAPDQEDPDELRGNLVSSIGQGEEDTSGEEEMGPNNMQMAKEHRKKMIAAVTKRKMNKASAKKEMQY
jgi:hypothetical protein